MGVCVHRHGRVFCTVITLLAGLGIILAAWDTYLTAVICALLSCWLCFAVAGCGHESRSDAGNGLCIVSDWMAVDPWSCDPTDALTKVCDDETHTGFWRYESRLSAAACYALLLHLQSG